MKALALWITLLLMVMSSAAYGSGVGQAITPTNVAAIASSTVPTNEPAVVPPNPRNATPTTPPATQDRDKIEPLNSNERNTRMLSLHPQYTTDARGEQVVVLPRDEYERLLEELEIRDDIRAAQEAEAEGGPPIPLEQVLAEMGRSASKRR